MRRLLLPFLLFACGQSAPPSVAPIDVPAQPPAPHLQPPPSASPITPAPAASASPAEAPQPSLVLDGKPGEWVGAHANAPVTPTGIWASGDLVIAAGPNKILRSEDRGRHWTVMDGPGDQPVVWGSSPNDVYVAGDTIVRSTDGGRTWAKVAAAPGPTYGIWGTPKGDEVWVVGGNPPFIARTKDHGSRWTGIRQHEKPTWLYDVVGSPDGKQVYFAGKKPNKNGTGSDAFLVRTFEEYGMELVPHPKYPSGDHDATRKLCFSGSGALFASTSYGVHVSRDQARSWKMAEDIGTEVLSLACRGKRIVAGGRNRQLRFSDDDGVTWKKNDTDAALGEPLVAITAVYVHPNGDVFVGAESYSKSAGGTLLVRRQ